MLDLLVGWRRQRRKREKKVGGRKREEREEVEGTLHVTWRKKGFSNPASANPFRAAFASLFTTVLYFLNGWLALCLREMLVSCVNYLVMTNGHIYMDKQSKLADTVTHSACVHKYTQGCRSLIFFQHLIYDIGTLCKQKSYMWMMVTAYKKGQASFLLLLHLAYISINFHCVTVLCADIPQHR